MTWARGFIFYVSEWGQRKLEQSGVRSKVWLEAPPPPHHVWPLICYYQTHQSWLWLSWGTLFSFLYLQSINHHLITSFMAQVVSTTLPPLLSSAFVQVIHVIHKQKKTSWSCCFTLVGLVWFDLIFWFSDSPLQLTNQNTLPIFSIIIFIILTLSLVGKSAPC